MRPVAHRAFRMVPPRAVALGLLLLLVVLGSLLVPPIDTIRTSGLGSTRSSGAGSSGIALLASTGPASEWTTYQGSPARDGYSDVDPWSQGETSWFDCPTSFGFRSGPVGNVSVVFAANTNGTIYAFEPNSTALFLWRYPAGSVVGELTFADPYLIYGDQGGGLRALWASNGSTAWAVQLGSPIAQTVDADNGTIYLVTQSGNVSARSVASGALLWSTPLATPVSGGVSEENDTLYVVATDGRVFALSLTGTVLWRSAAEGSVIDRAVDRGRARSARRGHGHRHRPRCDERDPRLERHRPRHRSRARRGAGDTGGRRRARRRPGRIRGPPRAGRDHRRGGLERCDPRVRRDGRRYRARS